MVEMKTVGARPLIFSVLLVFFNIQVSFAAFAPADNYLIACGSPQNVSFQDRTFVPDSVQFFDALKGQGNSVAVISSSNVPSPIYQSARVFTSSASYKFKIQQEGCHWVRLYFYPLPDSSHNLASASITVVTDDFVLLNNFTFKNYNGSHKFKEYAVNGGCNPLSKPELLSDNPPPELLPCPVSDGSPSPLRSDNPLSDRRG